MDINFDTTTTVLLVLILVALALASFLRPPPAKVHPLVLGAQAVCSPTRYKNQSPVFANLYVSPFKSVLRPEPQLRRVTDILLSTASVLPGRQGSFVHGGELFRELVQVVALGIRGRFGTGEQKAVVVVLDDSMDTLLIASALMLCNLAPILINPINSDQMETCEPSKLELVRGIVYSARLSPYIADFFRFATREGHADIPVISIDDAEADAILDAGKSAQKEGKKVTPESEPSERCMTFLRDGIPLQLTHTNLTSAIVAWRSLFPSSELSRASADLLPADVALSLHPTQRSFGFALALYVLYTGASPFFHIARSLEYTELSHLLTRESTPEPTHIFGHERLAPALYYACLDNMQHDFAFLIQKAKKSKLALLQHGVVSKTSLFDSLLYSHVRRELRLESIKGVFIDGAAPQSQLNLLRIALGAPVVTQLSHPFLSSPITSAHVFDFQCLPPPYSDIALSEAAKGDSNSGSAQSGKGKGKSRKASNASIKDKADPSRSPMSHQGAPSLGVELVLLGDETCFEKGYHVGELLVRSPQLPAIATLPPSLVYTVETSPPKPPYPESVGPPETTDLKVSWLRTGIHAAIAPEGTLWVV